MSEINKELTIQDWVDWVAFLAKKLSVWLEIKRGMSPSDYPSVAQRVQIATITIFSEKINTSHIVISPELLQAFIDDIIQAEHEFRVAVADGVNNCRKIHAVYEQARKKVCIHLAKISELNANQMPGESLIRLWESYRCDSLSYPSNETKESRGVVKKKKEINMTSILFLAADPTDASRLRLGEEFREIQEKLKLAKLRDRLKLELPQLSLRPVDICQALLDVRPQIVHFSGHGTSKGELCFEDQSGEIYLVQPDALAALFEQFDDQVNCVLLNACYSETQAKAIAAHIEYVIGMNQTIGDKAAIAFSVGFYQALGAGLTLEEAYKLGIVQIRLQGIPEYLTPVLFKKEQAQP